MPSCLKLETVRVTRDGRHVDVGRDVAKRQHIIAGSFTRAQLILHRVIQGKEGEEYGRTGLGQDGMTSIYQ